MNRKELKENAKRQISGNVSCLFCCLAVLSASQSLLFWKWDIFSFFQFNKINLNFSFCLLGLAISIIISPIIRFSLVKTYLKVSRDQPFSLKEFFKGLIDFRYTDKIVWLNILISVFTSLWSILLIIPGIIKSYSYSMAFYIMADNPSMKSMEALKESQKMMDGHKWELFILDLSFIWWNLLAAITFGVAYIYVGPYYEATRTNFYNYLKEKEQVI